MIIDGVAVEKQVGDVWSSADDLCSKHTCEIDQTGEPIESSFREYCSHSCILSVRNSMHVFLPIYWHN